ncbi:MAG: NAD(P)-dependent oxidoreductase [Phycisphaerae bacterium]|nr:MAG: NAD(P)-dependent oxidoreductase [Phycisphaerae bacterium]
MGNQVVVITGGGSGIGRAIALAFAEQGANVVVAGRNLEKLEAVASEVRALGPKCEAMVTDVAKAGDAEDLITKTLITFGRLDVLVNNAGNAILSDVQNIDLKAFDKMLAVNAAGPTYTSKHAFGAMKKNDGGTIVNISSMAAADPFPGLGAYGATKAYVNILTKALATEGKPHGIRAFAVGPGAVETEMLRASFPDFPAEQTLPAKAIAEMVLLLTNPACQYSSGQTIYVSK